MKVTLDKPINEQIREVMLSQGNSSRQLTYIATDTCLSARQAWRKYN